MQISDEMVEAARDSLIESSGETYYPSKCQMRAALEAALGQFMLQYGDNIELKEAEQIGFRRSADCIEELAAALKPFASVDWGYGGVLNTEDYNRARAVRERWGLK